MKRTARVSYLVFAGAETIAFISTEFNWIRTHWCVLAVSCGHCRAKKGSPCLGTDGPTSATHYVRRRDARGLKPRDAFVGIPVPIAKTPLTQRPRRPHTKEPR